MKRWVLCLGLLACGGETTQDAPPKAARAVQKSELDVSLDELAAQIVERLSETKKSKLAVNEFLTLKGETTDLGKFMSEELATRLIKSGRAQVVERRLLQKVLNEQEIGASQLVDDETAARVGKMLGADTLCIGTLTDLGSQIKVNARLINAETAEVYGAAAADLPKNRSVLALLGGSTTIRPAITTGPAPETRSTPRPVKPVPVVVEPAPQQTGPTAPSRPAITFGSAPARSQAPVTHANTSDMAIFLSRSPFGAGPDIVMLKNNSGYCVKVWLNGRSLRVFDGDLDVPCVPSGYKSFVKLPSFGEYQLQASGSSMPAPFRGIVAYQKNHIFSHLDKKKMTVTLQTSDFYSITP